MGRVWAARNEDLEVDVAIKLVHRHLNVEETTRRLLAEARAEARIEHPGIVRVLDVGATGCGDSFLVMELLEGQSLGKLLADTGRLTPEVAVKILLPVIDALAQAHEKGVVHRDLKPDNIFLADSGGRIQPKVVDFGIAQVSEQEPGATPTHQGAIVGTPGYMAPEQASGSDVDGRADVWSLSLVLYEALTGKAAFEATNCQATLRAIIEQNLLPTTELGIGDSALWQILERGLQKDRLCRLPSMPAMGRALAEWLVGRGETTDITGESVSEIWLAPPSEKPRSESEIQGIRRSPCRPRSFAKKARASMPKLELVFQKPLASGPRLAVPRRRRAGRWAVLGLVIAASLAITPAPVVRIPERTGAAAAAEILSPTLAPTPEHREQVPALDTEEDAVLRASAILRSTHGKSRPQPRLLWGSSTPVLTPDAEELKNPYL